jgi:hypothetical protein
MLAVCQIAIAISREMLAICRIATAVCRIMIAISQDSIAIWRKVFAICRNLIAIRQIPTCYFPNHSRPRTHGDLLRLRSEGVRRINKKGN